MRRPYRKLNLDERRILAHDASGEGHEDPDRENA